MALSFFAVQERAKIRSLFAGLLVKEVGVEEGSENFAIALDILIQNTTRHKFLDTDPNVVEKEYRDLQHKLEVNAQLTKAKALEKLVAIFLKRQSPSQHYDLKYSVLSLLYWLSEAPATAPLDFEITFPGEGKASAAKGSGRPDQSEGSEDEVGSQLSDWYSDTESDLRSEAWASSGDSSGGDDLLDVSSPEDSRSLQVFDWQKFDIDLLYGDRPLSEDKAGTRDFFQVSGQTLKPKLTWSIQDGDVLNTQELSLVQHVGLMRAQEVPFALPSSTLSISEAALVRQVLHMLQGIPGEVFSWEKEARGFSLREGVHTSHLSISSTKVLLKPLLEAASSLSRVQDWVRSVASATAANCASSNKRPAGPTVEAFADAVAVHLEGLLETVRQSECRAAKGEAGTTVTLLSLSAHLRRVVAEAVFLEKVVARAAPSEDSAGDHAEDSARLLSALYAMLGECAFLPEGEEGGYRVVLALFASSLRPLLVSLDSWIRHGALHDPAGELFFQANTAVSLEDPAYWTAGHTLRTTDTEAFCPSFLQSLATPILRTGKSLQLLKHRPEPGLLSKQPRSPLSVTALPYSPGRSGPPSPGIATPDIPRRRSGLWAANPPALSPQRGQSPSRSEYQTPRRSSVRALFPGWLQSPGKTPAGESRSPAPETMKENDRGATPENEVEQEEELPLYQLFCESLIKMLSSPEAGPKAKVTTLESTIEKEGYPSWHQELPFDGGSQSDWLAALDQAGQKNLPVLPPLEQPALATEKQASEPWLPPLDDQTLLAATFSSQHDDIDSERVQSHGQASSSGQGGSDFRKGGYGGDLVMGPFERSLRELRAGVVRNPLALPPVHQLMDIFLSSSSMAQPLERGEQGGIEEATAGTGSRVKVRSDRLKASGDPEVDKEWIQCLLGKLGSGGDGQSAPLGKAVLRWLQAAELRWIQAPAVLLQECLLQHFQNRIDRVAQRLLSTLLGSWGLLEELAVLRAIFLMGSGDVLHSFTSVLFGRLERREAWADFYELNMLLQESLRATSDTSLAALVHDSLVVTVGKPGSEGAQREVRAGPLKLGIDALDSLSFNYKVAWPLELIIDEAAVVKYNQVMSFLLQIKRAKYVLDKASRWKVAGALPGQSRAVVLLQHKLLHFVNTIHQYVMDQVLHSAWVELSKGIAEAASLDEIIICHNAYLAGIQRQCLVAPDKLWTLLSSRVKSILSLALDFCNHVHNLASNPIPEVTLRTQQELERLERQFHDSVAFLLRVLSSKLNVGHFPHLVDLVTRINYNGFYMSSEGQLLTPVSELSDQFGSNVPTRRGSSS